MSPRYQFFRLVWVMLALLGAASLVFIVMSPEPVLAVVRHTFPRDSFGDWRYYPLFAFWGLCLIATMNVVATGIPVLIRAVRQRMQ